MSAVVNLNSKIEKTVEGSGRGGEGGGTSVSE